MAGWHPEERKGLDMDALENRTEEKVSILGMSCRFPGARNIDQYREMLIAGKNAFCRLTERDLLACDVPENVLANKNFVRSCAPLENILHYDTNLSGLTGDQAAKIDPQFYYLWECTWEAMEEANCGFDHTDIRTGVFIGADTSWYALLQMDASLLWDPMADWDDFLHNDSHFLSTWLSYKFGFNGPSVNIQTACSTSLAAVHLACNALIAGDCDIAVAGGVSIRGPQKTGYLYRSGGIVSPTGICRPFDVDSDGTVLSSGAGVVVLSRLEDAETNNWPVLGNIIGSAVNNDGNQKLAFTAPNGAAQENLVRETLQISETRPDTIGYIETHGTGTELGDAVEIQSLAAAFNSVKSGKIPIGSCKANIGHLESAAGIAGLIKTILSVKHDEIYPLANFESPNPKLSLENTPFQIPKSVESYDSDLPFRRAGISSFGIGGTNAHIIIENAAPESDSRIRVSEKCWPVFGISAMTKTAGLDLESSLIKHLEPKPDTWEISGATLLKNRKPLLHRKAVPLPCDGNLSSWISDIKNTEFVELQKSPVELTLSFENFPNINSSCLDNLKKMNTRLGNIIESYTAVAVGKDAKLIHDSHIISAIIAFSLSEWCILLGLPIGEIKGFLSRHITNSLYAENSLEDEFKALFTTDNHDVLFNYPLVQDKAPVISFCPLQDSENMAADSMPKISLEDHAELGYHFAGLFSDLWVSGHNINWQHYFPEFHPVRLPTYPFQRKEIARKGLNNKASLTHTEDPGEKERSEFRKFLENLWEEILGHPPDECNDFFAMNGDSLAAMQFATSINNELPVSIMMEEIFENPIFEDIVTMLENKAQTINSVVYPLSHNQKALYALCERSPQSPVYNVYATYELKGSIDINALYKSFESALKNQDVFKTAFIWDDSELRQEIRSNCDSLLWEYYDGTTHEADVNSKIGKHIGRTFDLTTPPLFSVLLIKKAADTFYLSAVSHHIVSDEWSAQVIMRDVLLAYGEFQHNSAPNHVRIDKTFGEYVVQEQTRLESGGRQAALQYWTDCLGGFEPVENKMPSIGFIRESSSGESVSFDITDTIYSDVKSFAKRLRTTPFVVLLASFNILISRHTGQNDLCIGINLANRNERGVADLAGYFTNTLPLRIKIAHSDSFEEVVKKCQQTTLDIQKNQLPLSVISQSIKDSNHGPGQMLFDTVFVLQNVPRHDSVPKGVSLRKLPFHNGTSKFNIEFILEPSIDGGLSGMVEFKTRAFDKTAISGLIKNYQTILKSGIVSPRTPVFQLEILSESEKEKLAFGFNTLASDRYKTQPDFWECFRQIYENAPDTPAIITSDNTIISYSSLANISIALAEKIRNRGTQKKDTTIGIFCDRSEKTAIALLATQAVSKPFVLLDPDLPNRRLKNIIIDSGIAILITSADRAQQLREICPSSGREQQIIDLDSLPFSKSKAVEAEKPSNLAYIMYTSGSTGKPKGALVTRPGMMNHLHEKVRTVELKPGCRLAQTASLSFDISIWQFLAPLMCGATLVMFSDDQIFDVDLYLKRIKEQACTIVEAVPSYLEAVLPALEENPPDLSPLRYLMSTGEALPALLCNRWLTLYPDIPIINAYGPTECADDVLQHVIDKIQPEHSIIPAGRPLANLQIYILDLNMQPVPIEAIGEIYVGGIGVGLGYLNDPEKTKEAFLPDPFSGDPGARLYRTGDLGVWKNDGTAIYLGRKDTQIKINGARVELSEIDAVLNQCPLIKQAVSVYDNNRKIIIAFCIPGDNDFDIKNIRAYCSINLPSFMQPSVFRAINHIPRSSSGKVDRNVLLENSDNMKSPPGNSNSDFTQQEMDLKKIWETILGFPHISKDSNFFDTGGNSLSAIRLVALARRNGLVFSPRDVFRYPVLCDMALQCSTKHDIEFQAPSREVKLRTGEMQFLESAGKNIWLMDSAFLLELSPSVQADTIRDAVANIWELHSGLRAKFYKNNYGKWHKGFHSASTVPLSTIQLNESLSNDQIKTILSGLSGTKLFRRFPFVGCCINKKTTAQHIAG